MNIEESDLICSQVDLEKSTIEKCDDALLIRMFDAASKASHEEVVAGNGTEETKSDHGNAMTNTSSSISASSNKCDSSRPKSKGWKVGERCMALFDEDKKHYPARILKIFPSDKSCEVEYAGYEDSPAIVELKHLLSEEEVVSAGEGDEKPAAAVVVVNGEEPEPMEQTASGSTEQTTSTDTFPIPDICPPPPPSLLSKVAQAANDKEALSNMLMAWYMAGYHSGYFQGLQKAKKSS